MPEDAKTALGKDGGDSLLLSHLMDGGVALLLSDGDFQDDVQAADYKGLQMANMRLEEDCALQNIQQGG